MQIGFELMAQSAWSIFPGASFSMAIVWDGAKIPLSIGKDVYHQSMMVLPNKILTATGRLNYSPAVKYFEPIQGSPCKLVQCPPQLPTNLQVVITVPGVQSLNTVYQKSFLTLWQRKEDEPEKEKTVIFFDPQSVRNIQKGHFQIDLSYLIHQVFSKN